MASKRRGKIEVAERNEKYPFYIYWYNSFNCDLYDFKEENWDKVKEFVKEYFNFEIEDEVLEKFKKHLKKRKGFGYIWDQKMNIGAYIRDFENGYETLWVRIQKLTKRTKSINYL